MGLLGRPSTPLISTVLARPSHAIISAFGSSLGAFDGGAKGIAVAGVGDGSRDADLRLTGVICILGQRCLI